MASAAPCAIVIFGASGDLSKLKLVPAIYELLREGLLADKFVLVGYSRSHMSDEEYRKDCQEAITKNARHKPVDEAIWKKMEQNIFYVAGNYDSAEDHAKLAAKLDALDKSHETGGNRLFYISTPPSASSRSSPASASGSRSTRTAPAGSRLIIEKPFGRDLASARALNKLLYTYWREDQVFRIDHYLGKETVQNLMVMRFANSIFEPMWNHKYIDHVQITVSETLGADDRAGYYDTSGATRDMIQNHMFQLMALVAMEPPAALDAQSIRDEKVKVYKSVRPVRPSQVESFAVRGQYGPGEYEGKDPQGKKAKLPTKGWVAAVQEGSARTRRRRASRSPRPRTHRDLRRPEAVHRQLAVERHAVLHPHRQVPGQEAERGGGAVPLAAADAVPEAVRVAGLPQRPDHPRAAGGGDQLAAQRQGARRAR